MVGLLFHKFHEGLGKTAFGITFLLARWCSGVLVARFPVACVPARSRYTHVFSDLGKGVGGGKERREKKKKKKKNKSAEPPCSNMHPPPPFFLTIDVCRYKRATDTTFSGEAGEKYAADKLSTANQKVFNLPSIMDRIFGKKLPSQWNPKTASKD